MTAPPSCPKHATNKSPDARVSSSSVKPFSRESIAVLLRKILCGIRDYMHDHRGKYVPDGRRDLAHAGAVSRSALRAHHKASSFSSVPRQWILPYSSIVIAKVILKGARFSRLRLVPEHDVWQPHLDTDTLQLEATIFKFLRTHTLQRNGDHPMLHQEVLHHGLHDPPVPAAWEHSYGPCRRSTPSCCHA